MSLINSSNQKFRLKGHLSHMALALSILVPPFSVASEIDVTSVDHPHMQERIAEAGSQLKLINVNKADAEALSNILKGIGISKARAIVGYRAEFGPFTVPKDLMKVKGIGAKTVARFEDQLIF